MIRSRWLTMTVAAAILGAAGGASAQRRSTHVGYVYPAGGRQGTTFEAVVAGQFLTGVNEVLISGGGVRAKITEMIQPMNGGELNRLRIQVDELLARRAVARNDFKALQQFRSFKNAKSIKTDKESEEKELEAIKKKYAGATWGPEDEKQLMAIRKKMGSAVRRPANPAISELAVVEVTIAPDAAPGIRELRIEGPQAISNPLAFCVGQLPEFSETPSKRITEQKSSITKTANAPRSRKTEPEMKVELPAIVNGQILPGEIDRYRFAAKKGQRLLIAATARALIPYIPDAVPGWFQATLALYDAQGKELAYDDDYRFNPDPVLYYQIPEDGEYLVEIKDAIYRGREDFVYRIAIGELPFVGSVFPLGGRAGESTAVRLNGWNLPQTKLVFDGKGHEPGVYPISVRKDQFTSNAVPFAVDTLPECLEREPNQSRATAQAVSTPVIINGRIDRAEDRDVFSFEGRKGAEVVAEVYARRLGSPLDSVLVLSNAKGEQLALNDDHEDKGAGLVTHQADSYLRFTLPADGTYYLQVTDMQNRGGPDYAYRLRISPPRPNYELRIVPSSIIARGGTPASLTVHAIRKDGFNGAIELAAKDAPPGVTLSGGPVPAGEGEATLTLRVPPIAEPFALKLEGRATIEGREVSHPAVPTEDMMQAFEYRHLVPSQQLQVAVSGYATLQAAIHSLTSTPLKIPAGGTASLKLPSALGKLGGRVELELREPLPGIAIQKVSTAKDGTEVVVACDAARLKPGASGDLVFAVFSGSFGPRRFKKEAPPRVALTTLPAIPFEVVRSTP